MGIILDSIVSCNNVFQYVFPRNYYLFADCQWIIILVVVIEKTVIYRIIIYYDYISLHRRK